MKQLKQYMVCLSIFCVISSLFSKSITESGMDNYPKQDLITYPSSGDPYSGFENMLKSLETTYPNVCKARELGTSTTGLKIYSIRVSSDVSVDKPQPLFIGTGTMHGDEPTGFMCILYLIEWLCKNYETDPQATNIVDNTEMHFIPLVNPSGSYNRSGGTYGSQVRRTPGCPDINRSFPVPEFSEREPQYPDGDIERDVIIDLYKEKAFSIGWDIHTGMTAILLPWACTDSNEYEHPDFTGYLLPQANAFSQTVGGIQVGIPDSLNFYYAYGAYIDWAITHGSCRCFWLELGAKSVSASGVLAAWNKYKPGFLYLLEQLQFGIHGIIQCEGKPVKAKITVNDFDKFQSHIFSDTTTGYFVRPIQAGTFSLTITYEQYTVEKQGVTVKDGEKTDLGIIEMSGTNIYQKAKTLSINGLSTKTTKDMIVFNNNSASDAIFELFTLNGSKVRAFAVEKGKSVSYTMNTFTVPQASGIYIVTAKNQSTNYSQRITIW